MIEKTPGVAVVGCGYWGKNLVRNFDQIGALKAICDLDEARLQELNRTCAARSTRSFDALLGDAEIQGIVIAVPAARHFELARKALLAGKDVFVEKPLALRPEEGQELVDTAHRLERILMVGHLLEYHPAVLEMRRMIQAGELGRVQYIYSSRLNLGKLRTEENILWSFAPHDISVIVRMLAETPTIAAAQGGSYLNPSIVDTTLSTLEFSSGVKAHIFVSWLHPFKEQKLCVVGSQKMAVFDDLEPEKKLVMYAHRINWHDQKPVAERDGGQVIALQNYEPLQKE